VALVSGFHLHMPAMFWLVIRPAISSQGSSLINQKSSDQIHTYAFLQIFLIAQMACYAIPTLIIYNRIQSSKEHEPIAEVNPFAFNNRNDVVEEGRYQNPQNV
jgi:hypothetical protein